MIVNDYKKYIRERRERECFPIINRGQLWYNKLTREQIAELNAWYNAWLDAPDTRCIPPAPHWLNDRLNNETEEILI